MFKKTVLLLLFAIPFTLSSSSKLDKKVKWVIRNTSWVDLNVPYQDGKTLFKMILKNKFKRALDIGTSTGHSAIWIAWALSKTGGKLITIEINKRRYLKALKNFKRARLSKYIDARLANAHHLVPRLKGKFDFVFVDADKVWYINYLKAMIPKLKKGGCFVAHNVSNTDMSGIREFLRYLKRLKTFKTTIDRKSHAGMSISCKQ